MLPLQASLPAQSPVSQAGGTVLVKSQEVRAQIRPFQEGEACILFVWPGTRRKPPPATKGRPVFEAVPGHIGN
uniref:Uncharacterized protein n=1 Tax=Nymphaea colorata TaxID=210225 RepID=A0A5K0V2T4_9MAGN